MRTTIPDLPLLRKAIAWAEAEALKPESEREWDQAMWRNPSAQRTDQIGTQCGTSYCIAGYVCHVSGLDWVTETSDSCLSDGDLVPDAAQGLLGLTDQQAVDLFYADGIEEVRRNAESIAAHAGERL